MKEINKDRLRLRDILNSIITIEVYVKEIDFSSFTKNEMMQSA